MHMIRYAGISDKGLVRPANEDRMGVGVPGKLLTDGEAFSATLPLKAAGVLLLVSDGVGGLNAGEVASEMTVSGVVERLGVAKPERIRSAVHREALLDEILRNVNKLVFDAAQSDAQRSGMAATLTLLWLLPCGATIAQVGDSRCYRMRERMFTQLTEDQSKVAAMVRRGELSEQEAKNHPRKNVIEQAVGISPDRFNPVVESIELRDGDRFLLCSDGITDRLKNDQLAPFLQELSNTDLPSRAQDILDAGIQASGRDNLTVLLVEYNHTRLWQRMGGIFRGLTSGRGIGANK